MLGVLERQLTALEAAAPAALSGAVQGLRTAYPGLLLPGAVAEQPHAAGFAGRGVVLPGHGEQTSIGRERATNPYLLELQRGDETGRVTRGL